MANRLQNETSPYLLQHANNPVDWYPWGEEAFAEAKRRDVPIFLSVGYSTCYWCHVMERQSFENEAIAAVMNERFVCIKVDREERPDVDQLYMTAVQVQTGQGGWPMSVFMFPDGRPFYGGTYFPPADAHGRPGLPTVLTALSDHYKTARAELEEQADQITAIVQRLAEPQGPSEAFTLDDVLLVQLEKQMRADFEPVHGGFGRAPKFPRQTLLLTALEFERKYPDSERRQQLKKTLDAMAAGGIRDHLGGGFHRYSTDAKWLVPHFEIMLYDQAMMLEVYAVAAELFKDDGYRAVAKGIVDFVRREMRSPGGAFYTAFDAEVDAVEGDPYVWTEQQVRDVLGDDEEFLEAYGLLDGPNFHDPHGSSAVDTHNVLRVKGDFREAETKFAEQRAKLLAVRNERKQPMLDTKIITAWNARMIKAIQTVANLISDVRYDRGANRALAWLEKHHWKDGVLHRSSRDGVIGPRGVLEDYAYLLEIADCNDPTNHFAWNLENALLDRFKGGPGVFFETEEGALIVRQTSAVDSPLPAPAAVVGDFMSRSGHHDAEDDVVPLLQRYGHSLREHPGGMCSMLSLALQVTDNGPDPLKLNVGGHRVEVPAADQRLAPQRLDVVQVRGEWKGERELLLTLHVADGYHLHATPLGEMSSLAIGLVNAAGSLKFPEPANETFAYADEEVAVFRGAVPVTITFEQVPTEAVELRLRYQACTDSACMEPVTKTLKVQPECGGGGCGSADCSCS